MTTNKLYFARTSDLDRISCTKLRINAVPKSHHIRGVTQKRANEESHPVHHHKRRRRIV